ncbi:hypothetical protein, partial [Paraburkholderia atlantica]|uniref:hypothetical protein n=1 Tax=Paraburkholderia atlantica TaxID=2654982 RepID=UPI001C85D9BD
AASNSLLCMTCLRLDYAETGTIPPTGNSTEAYFVASADKFSPKHHGHRLVSKVARADLS